MTTTTHPADGHPAGWICPNHPFGHDWQMGLQCQVCGETRTASEAVVSVLASARGCSDKNAEALRDALVAETAATVLPLALVRMFPHGAAAHLAMQILIHVDVLEEALTALTEPSPDGAATLDMEAVSKARGLVAEFRARAAEEEQATAALVESTGRQVWDAPLSGTTARSLVKTIADAFLYAEDPQDGVPWWQAAREKVFAIGSQYEQVWKNGTTFYRYLAGARPDGGKTTA